MMTSAKLLETLAASTDETALELSAAVSAGHVAPVIGSPGREAAGSLHATFQLRDHATTIGEAPKSGFEATLEALQLLPREEEVLLYHFSGPAQVFTVFIRERDQRFLGCIRVTRKGRHNPGKS